MSCSKYYNKLSKTQKNITFDAIDFFVDRHLYRYEDGLSIRVKGHEDLIKTEQIHGDCDYEEHYDTRTPRDYVIRVDTRQNIASFICTVFHELVHVKQWIRGEMKQIHKGVEVTTFKWHKDRVEPEGMEYMKLPWEIEAHAMEKDLVCDFLNYNRKWKRIISYDKLCDLAC